MQEEADADARFIFCWIAFNAAYGIDGAGEAGATELECQLDGIFLTNDGGFVSTS